LETITRIVRPGSSLSAGSKINSLVQGEHPHILCGIGVGYEKVGVQSTRPVISLKLGKIDQKLPLTACIVICEIMIGVKMYDLQ